MTDLELYDFFDKIKFPDAFRAELYSLINRIQAECPQLYRQANNDRLQTERYKEIASFLGTPLDTTTLALCVMFGFDSKVRYEERGISDEIYYASQYELTIWAKRYYQDSGRIGTIAHEWLNNFSDPHVFRLGRLDFERYHFWRGQSYTSHGVSLKEGDDVINVHIPEDGPLLHEDVLASYRQAYRFFGLSGNAAFICHSWLLWPGNTDFLPPHSNIRAFMADYDIIKHEEAKNSSELWRVFGRRDSFDPASLPRDTSLRRNLADYLASHDNITGAGCGVFIHNGNEILK